MLITRSVLVQMESTRAKIKGIGCEFQIIYMDFYHLKYLVTNYKNNNDIDLKCRKNNNNSNLHIRKTIISI